MLVETAFDQSYTDEHKIKIVGIGGSLRSSSYSYQAF